MTALRAARFVWPRLLWSRRAQLVGLLLVWPLLLPLLSWLSGAGVPGRAVVFSGYLDTILPLAVLVHATRLVRDDVEARTIAYLLSRPIARTALLWGEMGALVVAMLVVCLPATIVGWLILGDEAAAGSLVGVAAAAILAVAAFGALFTLMGLVLRRPLTLGLVFLFGWERLAGAPGLLPRLTLGGYVRAVAGFASAPAGVGGVAAALVLVAVAATGALLAAGIFTTREYVPEP